MELMFPIYVVIIENFRQYIFRFIRFICFKKVGATYG